MQYSTEATYFFFMRTMEETSSLNGPRCDKESGICPVSANTLLNLSRGKLINNISSPFLIIISLSEITFSCKCICMDANCTFHHSPVSTMAYPALSAWKLFLILYNPLMIQKKFYQHLLVQITCIEKKTTAGKNFFQMDFFLLRKKRIWFRWGSTIKNNGVTFLNEKSIDS